MKASSSLRVAITAVCMTTAALLPASAAAQSMATGGSPDQWQFAATIYGYLPSIGGKLSVPVDQGGSSISVDAATIIDNLKMTFMGSFDVHNGRWGAFTDVLYLNVGSNTSQTRDFSLGGSLPVGVTADLNLDLKGTVWTLAGEYRVASDPAWTADVLVGARYFGVKPTLAWSLNGDVGNRSRNGSREINETVWDAIIGVKGAYRFGAERRWSIPFYLDVGTGQSDLTWQGAAGIAYSYSWGDLIAMWRYLDYNFQSGKQLEDMNFSGPMVGATFRW